MSNTEQQIEQEIQDKGLSAPRLTPDFIDSKIKAIRYLSGGVEPAYAHEDYFAKEDKSTPCLTICILTLENGFTVTGESACASPENFDKLIGQKIAYQNAREKIWMLEGYLLKDKLYQQSKPSTPQERVFVERKDLSEKLEKLEDFLSKDQPKFIDDNHWYLLGMQEKTMQQYLNLLDERIKLF